MDPNMKINPNIWSGHLLGKIIPGFPYPEKNCPYCQRKIDLVRAIHHDETLIYKAIFMCRNPNCEAYDETDKKAYVKVYYSCPEAIQIFETAFLPFKRKDVDKGPFIENWY